MQIHISWKALLAGLLFLAACIVLTRFAMQLSRVDEISTAPGTVTLIETPSTAMPASATAAVMTPLAPPQSPSVRGNPTSSPLSRPTGAVIEPSSNLEPTPIPLPSPTALPPSPTPFQPPTRIPTPVRSQVVVAAQGFGQLQNFISYAFVVSNPNPDVAAQDVLYQMAAYDDQGIVLTTDEGTIELIGPGQRQGFARELALPASGPVSRVEITLRQGEFVEAAGSLQLPVDKPAFFSGEQPKLTGIVRNPGNQDVANLGLVGIAYQDGVIVGGSTTTVRFIPAQGQAAFSMAIMTSAQPTNLEFFTSLASPPAP